MRRSLPPPPRPSFQLHRFLRENATTPLATREAVADVVISSVTLIE